MAQQSISIDEYIKSRPSVFSLDEYAASRPRTMSLNDFASRAETAQKKREDETKQTLSAVIGDILEQFGYEALESASFGLIEKPETYQPHSKAAEVAGSIGSFGGLLLGPGKLLKGPQRLLGKTLTGGLTKVAGKTAGSLLGYGASEIGGMGLLGLASDLNADPTEMAENAKNFGIMGAVFGAAKMIHIPAHPILGGILRQFGGRALGAVAGMYPKEYFNKENLPHLVWQEALNTFFMAHKITPQEIISGRYADPKNRDKISQITEAVIDATAPSPTDPIEIGKEFFTKPVKQRVKFQDIVIDQNLVDEKTRSWYKSQIRMKKNPTVELDFDPGTKRYTAGKDFNSALAAVHDINMERLRAGEEVLDVVDAFVKQDSRYTKTRLTTPAQLAYKLAGKEKIDQEVLQKFEDADLMLMTVTKPTSNGKLTAIFSSTDKTPVEVGDNQILFKRDVALHDLVPVVAGKNLKDAAWKGRTIPTEDVYNKIAAMEQQVSAMEAVGDALEKGDIFKLKMMKGKLAKLQKSLESGKQAGMVTYEKMIPGEPTKDIYENIPKRDVSFQSESLQEVKKHLERTWGTVSIGRNGDVYKIDKSAIGRDRKRWVGTLSKVDDVFSYIEMHIEPERAVVPAPGKVVRGQFDLNKMYRNAIKSYRLVKSMPEQPIPKTHQLYLAKRFMNLGLGTADVTSLWRSLDIKNNKPQLRHLNLIEGRLRAMEQADQDTRMAILTQDLARKHKIEYVALTGDNKESQDNTEVAMRETIKNLWYKATEEYKKDPTGPSPLSRMITQHFLGGWMDVRNPMRVIEERTGLPTYRIYRKLSNAYHAKRVAHSEAMKKVVTFTRASAEDQRAVRTHYSRMFAGMDPDIKGLTEYQLSYVNAIDELMNGMRDAIFDYRYNMWKENVKRPRLERERQMFSLVGEQYEEAAKIKDPRVYKSQDNPDIKLKLDRMFELEEAIYNDKTPPDVRASSEKEFMLLRSTLMQEPYGLGLVREGAYLPEIFTHVNASGLTSGEKAMHIDALSKTHVKPKSIRLAKGEEINYEDMLLGEHEKVKNLSKQLELYTNSVLNLKYFDKPLRALDDVVDMFYKDFADAKPNAFGKDIPEARARSLYDFLQLYSVRLKGFPIKIGGLGRALKGTQTIFFRSLTVRPMLIVRNYPQRLVTAQNKWLLLKSMGSGKRFKNLPEEVKQLFDSEGPNEMEIFNNQFLEIESDYGWANKPVIGHIWKLAGEVGKLYALSDLNNRKFVFGRTWFGVNDLIQSFRNGKIDRSTMEQKAGVNKMKPLEQREFREDIETGNDAHAAFIMSRYHTVTSQWYYGRHERSFQEMTPEGETMTNLLTWSKSMAQQAYGTYERLTDGYKRYKILSSQGKTKAAHQALRQSLDATAQVAGLAIAGGVANALLNTISLNHQGRYQAYGADMFTWEMGGVTLEILTQFTTGLADLVSSFDGTPDERRKAFDNIWKMADNVAIRQLFPFAKSALSVIESATGRSYLSPVYTFFSKYEYGYPKGLQKVDRTVLEGFMHGLFSTDPNKSEAVRRWTFDKYRELEMEYARATNPAEKTYLWGRVEQYKYLNDLFMRYTPYEAQKIRTQQMVVQNQKKLADQIMQYQYNLEKKMRSLGKQ